MHRIGEMMNEATARLCLTEIAAIQESISDISGDLDAMACDMAGMRASLAATGTKTARYLSHGFPREART